jgi:hypothetical protein
MESMIFENIRYCCYVVFVVDFVVDLVVDLVVDIDVEAIVAYLNNYNSPDVGTYLLVVAIAAHAVHCYNVEMTAAYCCIDCEYFDIDLYDY